MFENTEECFYSVRNLDRIPELYDLLSNVQKAARTLYLNKTCFNELYRVNSAGQFNAPFGKYPNPNIKNEDSLRAVSEYLNSANIKITSGDYSNVLKTLPTENSFVFLNPPYDSEDVATFTGYTKEGFSRYDQLQLRKWCDAMNYIKYNPSLAAYENTKKVVMLKKVEILFHSQLKKFNYCFILVRKILPKCICRCYYLSA